MLVSGASASVGSIIVAKLPGKNISSETRPSIKESERPWCTTREENKYIRVSSVRKRHVTGPQMVASLHGTHKTSVSKSTVHMRLMEAGHLDITKALSEPGQKNKMKMDKRTHTLDR